MWWIPLATAAVIGIGLWLLQFAQKRFRNSQTKAYRARYVQLVSHLESLTVTANRLESAATKSHNDAVLDYYESCLRVLETLISAIVKLPAFGGEASQLSSGFFLVRDCRQRFDRISKAFQDDQKGRKIDLDDLYGRDKAKLPLALGCYFCSRPPIANQFSQVRVKIDDQVREVLSCNVCRDELQFTKKVKVLYFLRDGRPVHWSEIASYRPSEDYWDINKRNHVRRETKFELLKGGESEISPEQLH